MKNLFMMSCTFIVIGAVINGASVLLKSNFLCSFLNQNLILLLVALLAINTTTMGVVLTKMREIADKNPTANFAITRAAMNQPTIEHLVLIGLSVIMQVAKDSPIICNGFPYAVFILDSFLIAIFIFSIQIVYDTAQSVYVILDYGH